MPALGSHYQLPNRDQLLSPELWKAYKEKYKSEISYSDFTSIIKETNKKIAESILEDEDGFKLPENLGYLCIIKYKTKKKAINWADTKKYGKKIYFLNLHSFGYRYHIKWFKTGISRFAFNEVFKFAPLRIMRTDVSKKIRAGKNYNEWTLKDFWDSNKLEKLVHKKLKLEDEYYKSGK
jgi:hypothetical protein